MCLVEEDKWGSTPMVFVYDPMYDIDRVVPANGKEPQAYMISCQRYDRVASMYVTVEAVRDSYIDMLSLAVEMILRRFKEISR